MLPLSSDDTFNFEMLHVLGFTRNYGADVAEVLTVAERIKPGDFENWHAEFYALAQHVEATVRAQDPDRYPVTARNAFFRAANYYRSADFFLHNEPQDPRIQRMGELATTCFNEAIARLPIPGERLLLPAQGFEVPAVLYRAARDNMPRPTLLLFNGYDGSQEEMLHVIGFAALERGIHVITFEGPGQPTVRRDQDLGFIDEWEKVVTPVLDYCQQQPAVDMKRVALLGYSYGGLLAPRAAAFDHRLAAVVCVDGVFDAGECFLRVLSPSMRHQLDSGDAEGFNQAVAAAMKQNTNMRWAIGQGCWAFKQPTPYDFMQRTRNISLQGVVEQVQCPVLVCEAADDRFFAGEPGKLAAALGSRATFHRFTEADAAQVHCQIGANDVANGVILNWLEDTLAAK